MLKKYRRQKKIIKHLRQWLREAIRVKKVKEELETTGTETEYCPRENVETQIEILLVYSKETEIEPCLVEDSEMQTEDPCVFPQETQTNFPTVDVSIQTDTEKNTQADCCMTQEAVKVAIQIDLMETHDDEVQTDETHAYIPLVREAAIRKLQNELVKTHEELTQHKEEVVPWQVHQELRNKVEALTIIEDETFSNYKAEQKKVEKAQVKLQKAKE